MRGLALRFPPSLPPASQPAGEPSDGIETQNAGEGACKVRARARVPSKRAPLSWVGHAAGAWAGGGARARPLPLPGEPPPFSTRPSSLPLPLPAQRPTACELLKRCRLLGRRCAPRGVLLPARRGLQRAHPLRDASSRPSTLCQPRGRRCPRRDRGKFTNTNPGPASPEALSPPPRPPRCTATSTSGLGSLAGRGQLAKGCCRGRREWGVAGA